MESQIVIHFLTFKGFEAKDIEMELPTADGDEVL
jgi:hypothetical protein